MYQISDVTPVVMKPEDIKTEDLKCLPPGISDVPVIKQENLESLGCECFVKPQIKVDPVENSVEIKTEELRCSHETNHLNSESKFVEPQIKVEKVENSVEIKTEEAKCKYETNPMDSESTAAMGGTGKVKTESSDEGDNTSNLVTESVTSLNSAVTTVDHLLMMKEDVLQTPTLVKTEVEEIPVKDEFPDSKTETAVLPSVEINPQTIDESAAATSASGRPRRSCKRINYSEYNDVGREANDQILMPSPKKTGAKGGRKPKRTTEDLARNSTMKPKFEKSPATGKVSSDQIKTCVDINEENQEEISTQDTDDEDDQDWRMDNDTDLVRNTSGTSSTMRNETKVDSLEPLSGEKPYACTQCDFRCATHSGLTSHTKIHLGDKKHKCPHCDNKSVRSDHLKMHLRTHTGEKPYSCTSCDYRSSDKGQLLRHIRVHTGEKPYSCTSCNYRSSQKGNLLQHILVHTGEKPYSCTSCDYRSSQKGALLRHIRVHTGEKPYACPHCSYRALNSSKLKRHVVNIHNGIDKYKCEAEGCDYRASTSSRLNAHMKTHKNKRIRISVVPQPPATTLTCYSCQFETPSRQKMKSHVLQHLVPVPPETNHVNMN